jgi:hypothetical protein
MLLAATLVLADYSARDLGFFRGEWGYTFPSMLFAWINLVLGLATLAVMAGAWFGPPKAVAVAGLVLIAILALRRQRLPRSWL